MEFYDIAMQPPEAETCCSVNPWKARLALNFKNIPHSTRWVPITEIAKVRRALDVPACRKHANGSDFYTLPILVDPSTGAKVGDSFDIAVYLQKTYPDSGAGDLFPSQVLDFTFDRELPPWAPPLSVRNDTEYTEYSKFNTHVDAAFSVHVGLVGYYLPLDSQASKDEMVRRAGVSSWEDFKMSDQVREDTMKSLLLTLGDLAKLFKKDTTGPFVLGKQPSYADLIVGGWLFMMGRTIPGNEWQQIRDCHDGVFAQLFDALQQFAQVK